MRKIPSLKQIYDDLGCKEKTVDGICWFECNTSADRSVFIIHGITGGKIDMIPLCRKYVMLGFAVYSVDLPGHGGSVMPEVNDYNDLSDWLTKVLRTIGRTPNLLISNSFASSIVYHALCKDVIPKETEVIMACPTPDQSRLADVLQGMSSRLPEGLAWGVYNCKPAQKIRVMSALKTYRKEAWRWLSESEKYKKSTLKLKDSNTLTTLLYDKNPYVKGVVSDYKITVVIGDKDNIVTPKTQKIMRDLLPMATFVTALGAGHILHFEAVDSYPES